MQKHCLLFSLSIFLLVAAKANTVFNPFPKDTLKICGDSTILLDAGAGFNQYNWNNGSTVQTISVSASGMYKVTVSNADGNFADSVFINIYQDTSAPVQNYMVVNGTKSSTFSSYGNIGLYDFYRSSPNQPGRWDYTPDETNMRFTIVKPGKTGVITTFTFFAEGNYTLPHCSGKLYFFDNEPCFSNMPLFGSTIPASSLNGANAEVISIPANNGGLVTVSCYIPVDSGKTYYVIPTYQCGRNPANADTTIIYNHSYALRVASSTSGNSYNALYSTHAFPQTYCRYENGGIWYEYELQTGGPATYKFKAGSTSSYTDPMNWSSRKMPPSTLPPFAKLIIDGNVSFTVPQYISPCASIIISPGSNINIPGNLILKGN